VPKAIFRDKVGRVEALEVHSGQRVIDLLRTHGIPSNAIIAMVNGAVVSEDTAVIGRDDVVELQQVRHYDLAVTRKPKNLHFGTYSNPVYTKRVLFDSGGDIVLRTEDFDEATYISYVDQVFSDSVTSQNAIFRAGEKYAVGLSGGRDSVAFLKLIERNKSRLPPIDLTVVTVTGLPDWDEPGTFGAARTSNEKLRCKHVVVDGDEIRRCFRLNRSFAEVMTEIVTGESNSMVMVITHHVMRRMIEVEAARLGVRNIVLGLNGDDLLASLVTWFTSGFQMGPLPVRDIGSFCYLFPLYRITKKELTLYLQLVSPELTRQGTPGRFTTGPGERSLAYAVADHLYDIWPGIDYYAFFAFAKMQTYFAKKQEHACNICGATYLEHTGSEQLDGRCDICTLFVQHGFVEMSRAAVVPDVLQP
jgi:tRNA(Ile)-lysidine synthase TilS/MesJ/sulfur carrier protein ThiS